MIGRALKWLFVLLLIAGALGVMSYAGARAAAGKIVGPNKPLSGRSIELVWRGVPDLRGQPRAWVITYTSSQLPGVTRARIVVTLTGQILSMTPPDLDRRVDAWERARLP